MVDYQRCEGQTRENNEKHSITKSLKLVIRTYPIIKLMRTMKPNMIKIKINGGTQNSHKNKKK